MNDFTFTKEAFEDYLYVDASGNYITDPKTCNRAYSYENYSTWGGYLMVTRK